MKENINSDNTRSTTQKKDNQVKSKINFQCYKRKNIKFFEDRHTSLIKQNSDYDSNENTAKEKFVYKEYHFLTCEDFEREDNTPPEDIAIYPRRTRYNKSIKKREIDSFNTNQTTVNEPNEQLQCMYKRQMIKGGCVLLNSAIKEKNEGLKSNIKQERLKMTEKIKETDTSSSSKFSNGNADDSQSSERNIRYKGDPSEVSIYRCKEGKLEYDKYSTSRKEPKSYRIGDLSNSNTIYKEDIDEIHGNRRYIERLPSNEERSTMIQEQSKKTPLDYLIEEAQLEQRKMSRVESYEKEKTMRNKKETFNKLKLQEEVLDEQLSQIEEFQKADDSIFIVRIENGVRMYFCPQKNCKKKFPSLSRVKRHYIVHTGEKPYKCLNKSCQKTFSRKDNMLQHYRNHCFISKKSKFREFDP